MTLRESKSRSARVLSNVSLLILFGFLSSPAKGTPPPERWIYLMKGEESLFASNAAATDVACFGTTVAAEGRLEGGHFSPPRLSGTPRRFHLVATIPWNSALAHVYLDPRLPFRKRILLGLVERARPFDGLQIDFEGIAEEDGAAFLNFLIALKKALPEHKTLSVAVPARWERYAKAHPLDAYDYAVIGTIADRVIVMAYDEHYRTGPPGPVASLPWCKKIYAHALKTIPADKLIMGIPLYGREWQCPATLSKALKYRDARRTIEAKGLTPLETPSEGGRYVRRAKVEVVAHYETIDSIEAKTALYAKRPICGLAFWRAGQEPPELWSRMNERRNEPSLRTAR